MRGQLTEVREQWHREGTLFEVGTLQDTPWRIAVSSLPDGPMNAAVLAERATALFAPEALLSVGVARSLRDDIAARDVVVATRIYAHQGGREDMHNFRARPRVWEATHRLE